MKSNSNAKISVSRDLPKFFLCFLFFAAGCPVFARTPATVQYRFDYFTTDKGLPQNGVRGIAQTPDGYLWFTTFDGLVRFDGLRFTVFDKNNTPGIGGNRFSNLSAEPDGTLLAGTEDSGLTLYRNGVFRTFTTADGLPSNVVHLFRRDLRGELFAQTGAGNAYLRDGKIVPANDAELPRNNFDHLSPGGHRWFYKNDRIEQITPDGRTLNYPIGIAAPNELLSGIRPFEDRRGNLWFGDLAGVYVLNNGAFTKLTEKDGVPPETLLRPFIEDDDGAIWFASGWGNTRKVGLVRYFQGKFSSWGADAGLSNLEVKEVFKDREGTLWVSTDKGLNRLRKQLITTISAGEGLADDEVYPLLQNSRGGDVYIGTTQGLSVYRNGQVTSLDLKNKLGDKISVTALFEDAENRLWIGAVGDLHIFEDGRLRQIPELFQTTVWAIKSDRQGNVWVGSEKGLFKFRDDRLVRKYTVADGLPGDDIKVIHEDRRGALWFGTYGGLAKLADEKFTTLTTADGLASNRIRSLYEDAQETLWIGTYDGGLSRFKDGRFVNFTLENGLFNNGVFQILEDARENFWISCNQGIYRVSRRELEDFAHGKVSKIISVAYGRQDGMLNTEANGGRQPAGIKTSDGRLWFPTQEGVAIVDPNNVSPNPNPPPVKIENVLIDRTSAEFEGGITLQANENNLEIRYTGISFIKPEQVKFRYRIEGLSENWTDVGSIREVYFPSLPAGEYAFHVIAANSDGVWNETGARLKITVAAPFWKKTWFVALAALAAIFIILTVFKLRERELRRRQLVQQEFARRLLESQEQERKRIASEMHDSLGQYLLAIKNWALFGLNSIPEKDAAREFLSEVSETSSLAIEEVREIAHNLRPYQLERLGLTNTLEYMLKNFKSAAGIDFAFEIEDIDGFLSKNDEIVFYRIVQECVNNVVKHSRAKSARLSVTRQIDLVEFVCRDDGAGFDVEAARNSSKSGLGLNGIAERVKILKGEYRIDSERGKGTRVTVRIAKTNE